MKSKKCTAIWIASIICFGLFIIAVIKLATQDAADASRDYTLGISLISGIIIAVIDIIELFIQSKKVNQSVISFTISSFKKENGEDMSRLAWALFFSASPIFILIGILIIALSPDNETSTSGNGQKILNTIGNGVTSDSNKNQADYMKINNLATSSNNLQKIDEMKYKQIQNIVSKNPGISDEELAQAAGINVDTARAHRPEINLSYSDINNLANSSNNLQKIDEMKYKQIQNIVAKNPGISNEELAQTVGVNVDTARAHRPKLNLSYQDINNLANSSNNLQKISEMKYKQIQNIVAKNPGISDEELSQAAEINVDTARAHRQN